jgi:hypothetical protein
MYPQTTAPAPEPFMDISGDNMNFPDLSFSGGINDLLPGLAYNQAAGLDIRLYGWHNSSTPGCFLTEFRSTLLCILNRLDGIEKRLSRLEQELARHHNSTAKSFQGIGEELREFSCDIQKKLEGDEAQAADDGEPSSLFHRQG